MAELVFLHLFGEGRTGSDNAHVATQHVEELRQFVQRILAQEPAQPGGAGIVRDLKQHAIPLVQVQDLGAPLFRVAHHGTELSAAKYPALFADALRKIEHRTL